MEQQYEGMLTMPPDTHNSSQLYEPYSDNPTTKGIMRISDDVLFNVIPLFLRDGWQVVSPLLLLRLFFFTSPSTDF